MEGGVASSGHPRMPDEYYQDIVERDGGSNVRDSQQGAGSSR